MVGGRRQGGGDFPVTCVVLQRGGRYLKRDLFPELEKAGFDSVVSVESSAESHDIEQLSLRHPAVKFILPSGDIGPGAMANVGVREAAGPLVLLMWSDARIAGQVISSRLAERIAGLDVLCACPQIHNARGEPFPTVMVPAMRKSSLKVFPAVPVKDAVKTLFPHDYMGVYSKRRYEALGGYDPALRNPWWQKLEFGFRAMLWGESMACLGSFRMAYDGEPPEEDATPDASYRRLWLRCLAVRTGASGASLPWGKFPHYLRQSGSGVSGGLADFREARAFVAANSARYRTDAKTLVGSWEGEGK